MPLRLRSHNVMDPRAIAGLGRFWRGSPWYAPTYTISIQALNISIDLIILEIISSLIQMAAARCLKGVWSNNSFLVLTCNLRQYDSTPSQIVNHQCEVRLDIDKA